MCIRDSIESALNNKAVSHAGAVGPWQLMAPTARLLGLKVGKGRDDRTDWYKSTNAAAKYLVTLYEDLNDWLLVVAAYNSGPTPVSYTHLDVYKRQALPIAIAMPKTVQPKAKVYKPVPLAHEKEYYGSMSGFVNEFVTKYSRTHNQTINVVHGRSNICLLYTSRCV